MLPTRTRAPAYQG